MKTMIALIALITLSCGSDNQALTNLNSAEEINQDAQTSDSDEQSLVTETGNVTIKFEKVRVEKGGNMCITIVPEGAEFPEADPDEAVFNECIGIEEAASEGITVSLEDGVYAVAVFHDENENGKLDMKKIIFIDAPAEGFGFSNSPKLMKGAPDFEDCAFEVDGEADLVIKMRKI